MKVYYAISPKYILKEKVKQLAQIAMVSTSVTLPYFSHPTSMGISLWLVEKRKGEQGDSVQMVV